MKYMAGVLAFLPALASVAEPVRTPLRSERSQDWFGAPVLPAIFQSDDPPPLQETYPDRVEEPLRSPELPAPERELGRGLTALDLKAWQKEDDLRLIREWAGDALLGLPLLVPQLVLEAVLPRGVQVGPTTFLYRTSPASSSLVLVVLDQALFHEGEFLSRVQEWELDRWEGDDLSHGQRHILRRSLMNGLRATYAVPGLTVGLLLQSAADQGPAGVLLVPPLGAALLYFKGIDQKFQIDDQVKLRFKLAKGRDWHRGIGSDTGVPALSFELRLWDLPVGIVGSFELSGRGMAPSFIGLGSSLEAVEEVLSREAHRSWRPD